MSILRSSVQQASNSFKNLRCGSFGSFSTIPPSSRRSRSTISADSDDCSARDRDNSSVSAITAAFSRSPDLSRFILIRERISPFLAVFLKELSRSAGEFPYLKSMKARIKKRIKTVKADSPRPFRHGIDALSSFMGRNPLSPELLGMEYRHESYPTIAFH